MAPAQIRPRERGQVLRPRARLLPAVQVRYENVGAGGFIRGMEAAAEAERAVPQQCCAREAFVRRGEGDDLGG